MFHSRAFFIASLLAAGLTLVVIVLGAYVRLSDAGLGCPDWPGCYGALLVPDQAIDIAEANAAYPDRPLHQGKAWKEMIHRYVAGALGLLILCLALQSWRQRQYVVPTTLLLAAVVLQGLLGMWTVTLLLKPVIVTLHLLGGMTILGLLYWLVLCQIRLPKTGQQETGQGFLPGALLGLVTVMLQIALGGWTSANYAALVCPEFPTCRAGEWWPETNFAQGFTLWRDLGIDYEGGVLDAAGRSAIHLSHRLGAVLTLLIVGTLALRAVFVHTGTLRLTGAVSLGVLLLQLALGMANIWLVLPLPVALAHNGTAALLLLCMVTLVHCSRPLKEA